VAKRETKLELPRCGACGALTRQKFIVGKGLKNSRSQHPRWRVCGRGHELYLKRG